LLQAAINSGVKKFVHVSSSSIHGENKKGEVMDEETPFHPLTHYAKSKVQGEHLLLKLADKGVTLSMIRPSVFYGSPASKNLNELMDGLRKGKKMPYIGKEGSLRSYVALQQVCDALVLAEQKSKTGEAYLITDTEPLTTKQFFQSICNGLKVECKTRSLPTFSSRIGEGVAMFAGSMGKHLRMANILGEFGRNHVVSNAKAVKELGFNAIEESTTGLQSMGRNFISGE
jgi:nucleoside-diphosphate-sugar epimerase